MKLGGSLLSLPDLHARLSYTIARFGIHNPLLIVGGGIAADLIRQLQCRARFDDDVAHEWALQAMMQNSWQLARLWSDWHLVADRDQAKQVFATGGRAILNVQAFLRHEEAGLSVPTQAGGAGPPNPCRLPLPHTWAVTSDSIAAWVAARWTARRVWLLKSCDPISSDVSALSAAGQVDAEFPQTSPALAELHWINLRAEVPSSWVVETTR